MIPVPVGTQIWVACGATDMRNYALHTNMRSLRRQGKISPLFYNILARVIAFWTEHKFLSSLGDVISARGDGRARTRSEVTAVAAPHGSGLTASVCN
jgi:hypothetical protein